MGQEVFHVQICNGWGRERGVGLASVVATNLQASACDVTAAYRLKQKIVPLLICRLFEATFNVDSVSLNFPSCAGYVGCWFTR